MRFLLAFIFIIAFIVVSNESFKDEVMMDNHKCQMIKENVWPKSVAPWCDKVNNKSSTEGAAFTSSKTRFVF